MEEFFTQGLGYKPPARNRLSITFFNDIYLETKLEVDNLLKANDMINIVLDESNNQLGNWVMNMTVLTKDHQLFHAYSKVAGSAKLDA